MKPWYQNPWVIGVATTTAVIVGASVFSSPSPTPTAVTPVQGVSATAVQSVTQAPAVSKTVEVQTGVQPASKEKCNPNYSGCLKPDASDYDCAGGKGNGPYYTGRVKVLGYDEYGLDRDGDGWGCE